MLILELTLKNFEYHRNLTVKFTKGINAIIGENGKGKTTIINALRFLVTGLTSKKLTKETSITSGEACGYVSGKFEHDGKIGYIERHLDSNKVILEFDGKKLKKAGEVKELWDELLQINPDIFSKVIIAEQGEIAALTDEDDAIREKVFQKIFLVPNTNSLRTLIWEYIKNAPQPYPEQNISAMEAEVVTLTNKAAEILKDKDKTEYLSEETLRDIYTRKAYLETCSEDSKSKDLSDKLEQLKLKLSSAVANAVNAKFFLTDEPLQQLQDRKRYVSKCLSDQTTISAINATISGLNQQLAQAQSELQNNNAILSKVDVNVYKEQLAYFTKLKNGHATVKELTTQLGLLTTPKKHSGAAAECPTCHQELVSKEAKANVAGLVKAAEDKLRLATVELNGLTEQAVDESIISINRTIEAHTALVTANDIIKTGITKYSHLLTVEDMKLASLDYYDLPSSPADELTEINANLSLHAAYVSDQKAISELQLEVSRYENYISGMITYDGKFESLSVEKAMWGAMLDKNNIAVYNSNSLTTAYQVTLLDIDRKQKEIEQSKSYLATNIQRKAYLATLHGVYDSFHANMFPRQLISSYTDTVWEVLTDNVNRFNFPYNVSINEDFSLKYTDKDGNVIPKLSGGQKIVMGLCLRFALHTLFAQSFRMAIYDEPTQNLSAAVVPLLFSSLKQFSSESALDQIFIIDHHDSLMDIADSTLNLNNI